MSEKSPGEDSPARQDSLLTNPLLAPENRAAGFASVAPASSAAEAAETLLREPPTGPDPTDPLPAALPWEAATIPPQVVPPAADAATIPPVAPLPPAAEDPDGVTLP